VRTAGLEAGSKGSKPDPIAFKTRNMFVGETLDVCRRRHQNGQNIEFEWFCLLANDVMRPAVEATKTWVRWYGDELGFNHVEEAIGSVLAQTWKDCRGRQRKQLHRRRTCQGSRHDLCRAPASTAAPHRRD